MHTENNYGFGSHLMLDCYGCPKDKLADVNFIFDLLNDFPKKINTTKIMAPSVFKYQGKAAEDWGVSGVVLIAESHISVHTFPDKQHAFIDVFSCKGFDTDLAREELIKAFEATTHEVTILDRGMHSMDAHLNQDFPQPANAYV
ncbi:S-adenosylmethionine decarboxylase proenzyme [candidate division WOR-1 bacterium RIFOXYB2_FULL_42_35]|uniref:S-adenosylmethionine decarboxylase proenzyme n=1 Tax=candidate division WOR-1 bacterium RIFOXYC2_FULL_41_25 TaxID=1802586 RepID=A0A1F4TLJ5_UNCSA|nr:MAG: S-adenosylmethionine decarboxylase proenzyme [candidate division WOR-1 bacterium RIFOXYA2_FULL_41_14]OGC23628.1 MAG: S-adenosylmethionine decarboxylase proenzyme [candidate division WOR-1 bacterium RIFOXYB2_FULL_42_35]OGC33592.1 MAG: S-adenosylmethionine decarboxylase proenzyme [candidate division WOR-1 bacterium RIFOXYC2_FULL_41_25]OGC43542.1 MAG: S-adenosylmethionine decarboxylase proenzyme [candidate division WOR-1 bacterium RIFOXYD2_FULL_41_8]